MAARLGKRERAALRLIHQGLAEGAHLNTQAGRSAPAVRSKIIRDNLGTHVVRERSVIRDNVGSLVVVQRGLQSSFNPR
jgi:hypothetical protein